MKIPFYMMCKKSVQLNERLLKRFSFSTDSFIVFYLSVNEQLQKTIRKERCKYCCILHECIANG